MSSPLAGAWAARITELELELRAKARGRAYGPGEARARNDRRRSIKADLIYAYRRLAEEHPAELDVARWEARIAELESGDLFAA